MRYITRVGYLTKQQQLFLAVVITLLLTGLAVKVYRTANTPPLSNSQTQR